MFAFIAKSPFVFGSGVLDASVQSKRFVRKLVLVRFDGVGFEIL